MKNNLSDVTPRVSVVMPVYNAARFVEEAIRSVLDQSLDHIELCIYDDGSTDGTREIVEEWASRDGRVVVGKGAGPSGLARSSNSAVALARADLIARLDADDVAHPDRLAVQKGVLSSHPGSVLAGALMDGIDRHSHFVRPTERYRLLRKASLPFPHSAIMFTRSAFERVGGYDPRAEGWEDIDLCLRLSQIGKVFVVTRSLVSYRYTATASGATVAVERRSDLERVRAECWGRAVDGRNYSDLLSPAPSGSWTWRGYSMVAAHHVWAGERAPKHPTSPRLKTQFRDAVRGMIYVTLGRVWPKGLRFLLATFIRLRDSFALKRHAQLGEVVEWHLRD